MLINSLLSFEAFRASLAGQLYQTVGKDDGVAALVVLVAAPAPRIPADAERRGQVGLDHRLMQTLCFW